MLTERQRDLIALWFTQIMFNTKRMETVAVDEILDEYERQRRIVGAVDIERTKDENL